jgi:RHS repeat-associated protein
VQYRYGADGQRALKFVANGGRTTAYFNKMWQMSDAVGAEWLQGKHVYVGEDRIATKYSTEGNDNTQAEERRVYYYHSDHLGSAQTVTNFQGQVHERLEYTPYGELWIDWSSREAPQDGTPFRFTGKELDAETGLYYYGARYLDPKTSRWLSGDPAMQDYIPSAPVNDEVKKRNGNLPGMGGVFNYVNLHVYHYAGNNPVKYTDPDGEWLNFAVGAGIGFVTAAAGEVGGRMTEGQSFGTAVKNTFTSGRSWVIMGTSAGIGALTSGASGIAVSAATKGATSIVQVAATNVAINAVSGAVDAAAKDVVTKAIRGEEQSLGDTAKEALKGAGFAALTSGLTQTVIGAGSARISQPVNTVTGTEINVRIQQPEWAGAVGVWGETIIPTVFELKREADKVIRSGE